MAPRQKDPPTLRQRGDENNRGKGFCYCTIGGSSTSSVTQKQFTFMSANPHVCADDVLDDGDEDAFENDDERCPVNGERGVSVLPDLLSLGKNDDFDPHAILTATGHQNDDTNEVLRFLQSSLNAEGGGGSGPARSAGSSGLTTGSAGRMSKLSNSTSSGSSRDSGIDIVLPFPEINIENAGPLIHTPSEGSHNYSGYVL